MCEKHGRFKERSCPGCAEEQNARTQKTIDLEVENKELKLIIQKMWLLDGYDTKGFTSLSKEQKVIHMKSLGTK